MSKRYTITYVHMISTSPMDVGTCLINDNAFSDRVALAKALRDGGALPAGTRLREMRGEGDRCVVFPDRGIWHSLCIHPDS